MVGKPNAEHDGNNGGYFVDKTIFKPEKTEPAKGDKYQEIDESHTLHLFFDTLCKGLCKDEIIEQLVVGDKHVVFVASPGQSALIDEGNGFTDGNHGVEVMGVDHGSDVEFVCNLGDQFINQEGGFRVEARVGFIAEQVAGIAGDGACDGGAFFHATAQLGGV